METEDILTISNAEIIPSFAKARAKGFQVSEAQMIKVLTSLTEKGLVFVGAEEDLYCCTY